MTIEELQREYDETQERMATLDKFMAEDGCNLPEGVVFLRLQLLTKLTTLETQIKRMSEAKRIVVFRPGDIALYKCPTCRTTLSVQAKRPDIEFCWHCDQKLDWGIEE